MLQTFELYWDEITAWSALITLALTVVTLGWILTIKKEPTSALAWCLLVLFFPVVGMIFFVLLGYQQVHRPVSRKIRHKQRFRRSESAALHRPFLDWPPPAPVDRRWQNIALLAQRFDALPPSAGNYFTFYCDGAAAFAAKLEAIHHARHHVHLEYFIVQPDATGRQFLDLLTEKVQQGVEVRLLYDAMGSRRLHRWTLRALRAAGGKCTAFLPLDPLRRRIQVNMRNHRKLLVVDGTVAFTGGLNIGDEYLGKVPRFGYWRDTHLRVRGPVVAGLQRLFSEDWDFAAGEHFRGSSYFPGPQSGGPGAAGPRPPALHSTQRGGVALAPGASDGAVPPELDCVAQVIQSGPDQPLKGIREVFFAAILRARKRLWLATPYFVPDAGLRDALCLAAYQGVDVRLLGQFAPDKWIPYYASRYYWAEALEAGVKVYQYTRGMMHSKVTLVDNDWAMVGTANLDNRSMHLNFEVDCLIYSAEAVAVLEQSFLRDFSDSVRLQRDVFAHRPFSGRLMENACRLLSPVL